MTDAFERSAFRTPLTAQEAVLEELRQSILDGRVRPGDPIRQDLVAERLGVSRVPVREALRILEGEGQVTYRRHRGYFVRELDPEELTEIYMIRGLLEAEAVRRGARRITGSDIEAMRSALDDLESDNSKDVRASISANRKFHFILFEAAQSPRLVQLIKSLWDHTDPYRTLYYMDDEASDRASREHREILRDLERGDIDKVLENVHSHHETSFKALLDALEFETSAGVASE